MSKLKAFTKVAGKLVDPMDIALNAANAALKGYQGAVRQKKINDLGRAVRSASKAKKAAKAAKLERKRAVKALRDKSRDYDSQMKKSKSRTRKIVGASAFIAGAGGYAVGRRSRRGNTKRHR